MALFNRDPDSPRPPPRLGAVRRIAVVVTRQIGDVLLTTPLIEAVHARWPEATIDVIGFAGTLGMLDGNRAVSARVEMPARPRGREALTLAARLWRRYDLAFVAEASDRAHAIGWLAARRRVGLVPARRSHAWWKRLSLAHAVTVAGDRSARHVAAEKLALLAPWQDAATATATVSRVVPPAPRPLPDDLVSALGAAPVVVQAPSMWRYKQWPIERYARVVEALLADGHQVVLTGGAAESDREKVASLAQLGTPPRLLNACGRLDLNQLANLLSRAALYVGPDTSITHLAAAVGVPVIALFGPTNPMRWGPLPAVQPLAALAYQRQAPRQQMGRVILLQGEADCAPGVPCGRAGCEDRHDSASACLERGLSPGRVIAEVRSQLTPIGMPQSTTPLTSV